MNTPQLRFEPQLHIRTYAFRQLVGKTALEIYELFESKRTAIKKATDYQWDNQNFYIDDIYGKPALKLLVQKNGICIWNAKTGTSLHHYGHTHDPLTEEDFQNIQKAINKIEDNLTQCTECGEWVKKYKKYSYTGATCEKCYNPKKHTKPDTK